MLTFTIDYRTPWIVLLVVGSRRYILHTPPLPVSGMNETDTVTYSLNPPKKNWLNAAPKSNRRTNAAKRDSRRKKKRRL